MHGQSHFACALFVAMGSPAEMVYGRNFDWEYSPALLIFTDPPDGYASASMVDLTFLGIPAEEAAALQNLQTTYQEALLSAPALPFDGMNEYGLAIGMAAVPEEYIDDASFDPSRPDIGSIGIIRQVLDHARNVEEALSIFKQFNVMYSGGPPIHYLIADPSGKAVLVEFFDGEMVVLPNESPWHLATNHLRCIAEGDGGCSRYHKLDEQLTASGGQLDTSAALQLLSDVKQGITQWSSVYNMNSGDISIVIGRDYDKVFSFRLDLINP
jgi:penicillin V acylase-like amidase (Ntn superfamily)